MHYEHYVNNKYEASKIIDEFFSDFIKCRKKIAAGEGKIDENAEFVLRISCGDFNEDEATIFLANYAEIVSSALDQKNKDSLVVESYEGWAKCNGDENGWIKCFLEKRVGIYGNIKDQCLYDPFNDSFELGILVPDYEYYISYGGEFQPISEEECLSKCSSLVSDEAFCSLLMEESKEVVR